jgi:hypothetical protein
MIMCVFALCKRSIISCIFVTNWGGGGTKPMNIYIFAKALPPCSDANGKTCYTTGSSTRIVCHWYNLHAEFVLTLKRHRHRFNWKKNPNIHAIFLVARDSERPFAVNSIPEVGFSSAHKPLFIFLRWLQKNPMRSSRFPVFRTTCLLNVFCGEFSINVNVILTSKIKHFEERQFVYPS